MKLESLVSFQTVTDKVFFYIKRKIVNVKLGKILK
jgi:hypothetical protein